jgi:aryl-alcohol dehydrogenase-like predicted oxidoreductase
MKALHDLVQSGKVRYLGASSMWTCEYAPKPTNSTRLMQDQDQFARMQFCAETNLWTKFISMQNHYSLCYREEEREMNRFCHETGVGIIPWAPLYDGDLARPLTQRPTERGMYDRQRKVITEADEEIVHRVEQLAKGKGYTMVQVALTWARKKGTIPVVGINNVARLDEACDLRGKDLTRDEITYLEEPYIPKRIAGHT